MAAPILEIIADGDKLGEAPYWDAERQRLLWSDIYASTIYAFDPATGEKSICHAGDMVFGLVLHRDGGFIVTGATGMHYVRPGAKPQPIFTEYEGQPVFLNDAIADAQGRVYTGTVYWGPNGLVKRGHLFLVDIDGSAKIVDTGVGMANGLGFSPDNKTFYFTDTYEHSIFAYDVDEATGALSNKRTFVKVPRELGMPDGMTVDADGNVWCAIWYSSRVVCYDPQGNIKSEINLPVRQVASVMFGGKNLDELYITSSSVPFKSVELGPEGYDFDSTENLGGSVYRTRPGARGKLEHLANIKPPG